MVYLFHFYKIIQKRVIIKQVILYICIPIIKKYVCVNLHYYNFFFFFRFQY